LSSFEKQIYIFLKKKQQKVWQFKKSTYFCRRKESKYEKFLLRILLFLLLRKRVKAGILFA